MVLDINQGDYHSPDNLDVFVKRIATLDRIRRDKNILAVHRAPGSRNLSNVSILYAVFARSETCQHVCANGSIHVVHEDVKFIEASQR